MSYIPFEGITLIFISGNKGKISNFEYFFQNDKNFRIFNISIDTPEIQGTFEEISKAKLTAAYKNRQYHADLVAPGTYTIVEDTSLSLNFFENTDFPGPYIKYVRPEINYENLYRMCIGPNNYHARETSTVAIGNFNGYDVDINIIKVTVQCTIVAPRGEAGFAYDPVVQPDDDEQTYAEMSENKKLEKCARGRAFHKVREFIRGEYQQYII